MALSIQQAHPDEIDQLIPILLQAEESERALRWGLKNLVDAVYLGERPSHRVYRHGERNGPLLRTRRKLALAVVGHDLSHRAVTICQARTAVLQLGLSGRVTATCLRGPARSNG